MKSLLNTLKNNRQIHWGKVLRVVITAVIAVGVIAHTTPTPASAGKSVSWGGCAPGC